MDRNDYYGGESASVNLNQLFEKFGAGQPGGALGNSREYNIDLAPKFIMANGILVKMLIMTVRDAFVPNLCAKSRRLSPAPYTCAAHMWF